MKAHRLLVPVLLLILAGSAMAEAKSMYGKSGEEALALGQKKWLALAASQPDGQSLASRKAAADFYADASSARVEALLSKVPEASRDKYTNLRDALYQAANALLTAERVAAGGYTGYDVIFPVRQGLIDDEMYAVLKGTNKLVPTPADEYLQGLRKAWIDELKETDIKSDDPMGDPKKMISRALDLVDNALDLINQQTKPDRSHLRLLIMDWYKTNEY